MKKLLLILFLFTCNHTFVVANNHHLETVQKKKKKPFKPPYQGKRHFCSDESKMTYDVTIKGNDVVIAYSTVRIKGTFKNGLLFTNDPKEIEYIHYGGKSVYGKYYILQADYFSVINTENSEYFYYQLCKK